jgi:hypothetical protein
MRKGGRTECSFGIRENTQTPRSEPYERIFLAGKTIPTADRIGKIQYKKVWGCARAGVVR